MLEQNIYLVTVQITCQWSTELGPVHFLLMYLWDSQGKIMLRLHNLLLSLGKGGGVKIIMGGKSFIMTDSYSTVLYENSAQLFFGAFNCCSPFFILPTCRNSDILEFLKIGVEL